MTFSKPPIHSHNRNRPRAQEILEDPDYQSLLWEGKEPRDMASTLAEFSGQVRCLGLPGPHAAMIIERC